MLASHHFRVRVPIISSRRGPLPVWAVVGIAVVTLVLSGCSAAGRLLVASDQPEWSDAILVLGGDFHGPRVLKGADLGAQGYAPMVLVSGPPYGTHAESDLAIEHLVDKGYRRTLFVGLPHRASSTTEEAIALAPQLRRLGIRTAILVTRASHSRRALIVFRLFCPDAVFTSAPAAEPSFDPDRWWTSQESRKRVFTEWFKIVGTVLIKYPQYVMTSIVFE